MKLSMHQLNSLIVLGILLISGCGQKVSAPEFDKPALSFEPQLKAFFATKEQQARKLAAEEKDFYANLEDKPAAVRNGIPSEVWSYFAAARVGNWEKVAKLYYQMAAQSYQFENPKNDERLTSVVWQTVNETFRAYEQLCSADPKYVFAYAREIINSIPRGGVLFAGSDAGRFVVTFLARSQIEGDPFFIISQNSLTDGLNLVYLRSIYGGKFHIPTSEESATAFQDYISDAQLRLKENRLKLGEYVKVNGDRVEVSGKSAVMGINAILAKNIFDKTPDREFFLDESEQFDWMNPLLEPHGLIFKINRAPLMELSPEIIGKDREFWSGQVSRMIGNWLTEQTALKQVCDFSEKTYLQNDRAGFTGDPQFAVTVYKHGSTRYFVGAGPIFSNSRANIADLYAWRAQNATSEPERERMIKEADFAFRQALALCPSQPDTAVKYINFLFRQRRTEDAILVVQTAQKFHPKDKAFQEWAARVVSSAEEQKRKP
jgi:hypothetical protein